MASFHSLDDSALKQVLLRCHAVDFASLSRTCRRFRSIIDSRQFRKLRIAQDWVEVKATIAGEKKGPKRRRKMGDGTDDENESYYNNGVTERVMNVVVDNRKAGKISFVLVNRMSEYFHSKCDDASLYVAKMFFDRYGRALHSITSVRQALGTHEDDDEDNVEGFLYISRVSWRNDFFDYSLVGAKAIRSILFDSSINMHWSICIYIPDSADSTYFIRKNEMKESGLSFSHQRCLPRMKEEYDDLEALRVRNNEFAALDARHFLRAGFQQVKETLDTSHNIFLFAVRSFLDGNVRSDEETRSIQVHQPKREQRLADEDFLQYAMDQCCFRRLVDAHLQSLENEMQEFRESAAMLNGVKERLSEVSAASQPDLANERKRPLELVEQHEPVVSAMPPEGLSEQISLLRLKLEAHVREFTEAVKNFRSVGADVRCSLVIHACASNVDAVLLDALLESIGEEEVPSLVNALDQANMTPLMRAALTPQGPPSARLHAMTRLFHHGADKNIVDASDGYTALGKFRVALNNPLADTGDDPSLIAQIQELLMPVGGPTPADNLELESD